MLRPWTTPVSPMPPDFRYLVDPARGPHIRVTSGHVFYPLCPRAVDVTIGDIAHALAIEPRYTGHTFWPNSVAEHSTRVSHVVELLARILGCTPPVVKRYARAGLMHDSPEAYIRDWPRPLKRHPDAWFYRDAEARLAALLEAWSELPAGAFDWRLVKLADHMLCRTEQRDLCAPALFDDGAPDAIEPLTRRLNLWTPRGVWGWARELPRAAATGALREAVAELAESGPWPWWHAERRFLRRWEEVRP